MESGVVYCVSRVLALQQEDGLIIIEGPDGAGKTTLVHRLMEDLPELIIGKRGTNDRSKLYEVTVPDTFRALSYAVDLRQPCFIWDRLFYSEFVYAPLGMPPREPMFNETQRVHISRLVEALHCPVVLCLPRLETVQANMAEEREQMGGVRERIADIWRSYHHLWLTDWFPANTILYRYDTVDDLFFSAEDSYKEIRKEVRDYIEFREEGAW